MIKLFICLSIISLSGVLGLKFTEKRNVTTSLGKTYTCFYTLVYTDAGIQKKKSSVSCRPNNNGGVAIEKFYIPELGWVQVDAKIAKSGDSITSWRKLEQPPAPASVPMNCSCLMTGLEEMWNEMWAENTTAAGRKLESFQRSLTRVSLSHDEETNKSLLRKDASNRLFLLKPLLLLLLLPVLIPAIQAALAALGIGRSLAINNNFNEVQERKEKLERLLEELQDAEARFESLVDEKHHNGGSSLFSTIFSNFLTQLQTNIQNFLNSLLPAGRKAEIDVDAVKTAVAESRQEDKTLLFSLLFSNLINQIRAQIQANIQNFLNSIGLGRSLNAGNRQLWLELLNGATPPPPPASTLGGGALLEQLLSGGGNSDGGALLEQLLSGGSLTDGAPLLELLSGGGDASSLLTLLGGSGDGAALLESVISGLGGADGTGMESLMESIVQQQVESMLSELNIESLIAEMTGVNGGLEEVLASMGINGGLEELMAGLESSGNIDQMLEELWLEIEAEIEAEFSGEFPPVPLQCDCVPREEVVMG